MSLYSVRHFVSHRAALVKRVVRFGKAPVLALAGAALVAVALLVAIGHVSKTAQAFTCTSNPCPYDEKTGAFIGYPKAWPPGCGYFIDGLPASESGQKTQTGNIKYNPFDRRYSNTAVPQCYPEDVSAYGFTYYERGHRMQNKGVHVDRETGLVFKYKADGSFAGVECFFVEKCGNLALSPAAASAAAALSAATGGTDATAKSEAADPVGWLDSVTCAGAQGWAFDTSDPLVGSTIHLYVDGKAGGKGTLLTSGSTTETRDDINKTFSTSGPHGFTIQLPDSVRDGKSHTLYAYAIDTDGGTNLILGGGGKTFTCTGTTGVTSTNPTPVAVSDKSAPLSWFDSASAKEFKGWAFDQDNASSVIDVHFYADAPVGSGGKLLGYAKTTEQRDDINSLYKISGTHGFTATVVLASANSGATSTTAGAVTIPLALQDGKAHAIYAYAIDSNGSKNPLTGGSPKSAVFGSAGGAVTPTPPPSTGSGGVSNRHNYLSPCDGAGIAGKDDPAIVVEVKADGSIVGSIDVKNVPDAVVKINGTVTTDKSFVLKAGDSISVTTKNGTYSADADGLAKGENASVLVPMPCIRIGYDDIMGGQQCGEGQDGTCADELDAFINVESIQAAGLKDSDYEIWYKVKGGKYDTGGWKKYDWKNCGQYSNHCIRLAGAGVIYAKTKVISGNRPGSWSLTTQKEFDVAKGKF